MQSEDGLSQVGHVRQCPCACLCQFQIPSNATRIKLGSRKETVLDNVTNRKENVRGFPGIADPNITTGHSCHVSALLEHIRRKLSFLRLILILYEAMSAEVSPSVQSKTGGAGLVHGCFDTHVQNKHGKSCLLSFPAQLLFGKFHILLQLPHGIFQRCPCVIHLIDNQNIFANKIGHFQRAQVEPLRARDLGAWSLDRAILSQVFVQ